MVFIALVAALLLFGLAAQEGRKSLASLAIVLGVFALITSAPSTASALWVSAEAIAQAAGRSRL